MADTLIKVDLTQPAPSNPLVHNRWHPDIPIAVGQARRRLHPRDLRLDRRLHQNNDSADDVRDVDLTTVHYLSGPVGVQGAEPGDLLVVDLLDIGARDDSQWGFNGFFSKQNGGGFLTDHFPAGAEVDLGLQRHVHQEPPRAGRGIRRPDPPGLIGCLPDKKMLDEWNKREAGTDRHRPRPRARPGQPPFAATAHCGKAQGMLPTEWPPKVHAPCRLASTVATATSRTCRAARIFFPVYVDGGGLSVGDLHFSQGDGEITFCGAIEMAGWVHMRVNLIKGGVAKYGIKNPIFKPSPITPNYKDT